MTAEKKKEFEKKFCSDTWFGLDSNGEKIKQLRLSIDAETIWQWIEQTVEDACKKQRLNCLTEFDNYADEYERGLLERNEDGERQRLRLKILNSPSPEVK